MYINAYTYMHTITTSKKKNPISEGQCGRKGKREIL